jgi:hypothetical protein
VAVVDFIGQECIGEIETCKSHGFQWKISEPFGTPRRSFDIALYSLLFKKLRNLPVAPDSSLGRTRYQPEIL